MVEIIKKHVADVGRVPTNEELARLAKVSVGKAFVALDDYKNKVGDTSNDVVSDFLGSQYKEPLNYIQIALFIISGVTYLLSLYFTGLWFKSMFHIVIASAISFSMVTYMVISPSLIKKGYRLIIGFTFLLALFFSMGSTIAGQYNKTIENSETLETNNTDIFLILDTREVEALEYIEDIKKDKEVHENTIIELSKERIKNQAYIGTERNKIAEYNGKIEEQHLVLNNIRLEKSELLTKGIKTVKKVDFYSMLSELFNIKKTLIQFVVQVLPAIFIDVISALCFNLAIKRGKEC